MPTKITRKLKLKRRLKKEFSSKRKYKTTYKDIKTYFRMFNAALFESSYRHLVRYKLKTLLERSV